MTNNNSIIKEQIIKKIFFIRGKRVMVDQDLAELYNLPTKSLNLAVKRNIERFPDDFMFQLTKEEYENLRFQFETSRWGGRRYYPYVFTEQGVAMLSSVLNSKKAIHVNIQIMRAFIKLKEMILTNHQLKLLIEKIERRLDQSDQKMKNHEKQIHILADLIEQLLEPPEKTKRKIGFDYE